MKNGEVKVVTAAVDNRRRRIVYLVPLFLAAVALGFLLELSTYETLNFSEIRSAIAHIPHRLNQIKNWQSQSWESDEKSVSKVIPNPGNLIGNSDENLEEQSENEVVLDYERERPMEFWELPALLNINFTWIKNNENICARNPKDPADLRIMPVLVHTARSHFQERRGGSSSRPEVNLEQFEEQEKQLDEEQKEYGDLVIGSFTDSYHNLTYKHLMGYKWVLNFCRNAEFVLKVDDDMFIDILRFLNWRSDDLDKVAENKTAVIPELYCHTFAGTKPIRQVGSKWYASEEDWPDEWYPDYCSGWAYEITVDLIHKIYSVSNHRKLFWVDDVFVTGALLEIAKQVYEFKPNIRHIWGEVTGDIKEYRPICEKSNFELERKFKAVVYVPRGEFFERDMMCMWNKTLIDSKVKFK
ncbi:Beta-1,3-galactosyltransferase 1 [Orchesella cincta]|uniref:Hexosyltransferase n=1 Tax=Orchesella cincta TaxID=48709 RepID=A0A1D2MUE1_ORCCI|nr:Beta-1,3-galactosyltransferase 1 [Orchesella cincta]